MMNQCAMCTVPIVPGQEKWVRRENDNKRVALCSDCLIKPKPKPLSARDKPMPDWLRQLDVENEREPSFKRKPIVPDDVSVPDWLQQAAGDKQKPTQSGPSSDADIPEWLSVAIPLSFVLFLLMLIALLFYVQNNGAGILAPLLVANPYDVWLVGVIFLIVFGLPLLMRGYKSQTGSLAAGLRSAFAFIMMIILMIILALFLGE